jgi:hypothetical protein
MTYMMNREATKFGEFLPSFCPEYFVFPPHVKKLKIQVYKTVIFPAVLYGCETWSLTLRGGGTQTEGFWEQDVEEDIWT